MEFIWNTLLTLESVAGQNYVVNQIQEDLAMFSFLTKYSQSPLMSKIAPVNQDTLNKQLEGYNKLIVNYNYYNVLSIYTS